MVLPDCNYPFSAQYRPEPQLLARIAPGIIWVAALFHPCWHSSDCSVTICRTAVLTIDVVAVTLARRCAGEGDGDWMVTGLPLLILSPLVAMLLEWMFMAGK